MRYGSYRARLAFLVLCLAALARCAFASETRVVTDVYGRRVEVPAEIRSIVCTGSGALRLICYAKADDLLIGCEDADKQRRVNRAYNYAFHDKLAALPSIGKGGGRSYTAYEEELIGLRPDVIFSAFSPNAVEELARKTGIPVVAISYGQDIFDDPDLEKSLSLIGSLLGRETRCRDILALIAGAKADLARRAGGIAEADKAKVYNGAMTFSGARGFGGTAANFAPLAAIGARNLADAAGEKAAFVVDLEQVLEWDPDVIFIDPGNLPLVNEEYRKNPGYFKALRAVAEGRVYAMIAYNSYSPNIEIALADAYYAGMVLFPERFADIDIAAKADELLTAFLGKAFYADMAEAGLRFAEVRIGD